MEDLVREVESLTNQLEDLKDAERDLKARTARAEHKHQSLVKELVELNGWGPIVVDGQKYLPYQEYSGEFGIRKI